MMNSAITKIENIFRDLQYNWSYFNTIKHIRWIPALLIALVTIVYYWSLGFALPSILLRIDMFLNFVLLFVAAILLIIATYIQRGIQTISFYLMVVSLGIILYITNILYFLLILLGLYLIYVLLETLRINRIEKIANMTPGQLSGIKYTQPEVEVIIRSSGRK